MKPELRKPTVKEIKKLHMWLRVAIQLLFFLFLPSVYTAAFSGAKYIFTQIGQGDLIRMNSFVSVLVVLILYTVLFGRFFCGYACAFGSLGDAVHMAWITACKKLGKKPMQLSGTYTKRLDYVKYLVLAAILIQCYLGLAAKTQSASPWVVFSMLHAGNFELKAYGIGIAILLFVMIGMCVQERFFCRFFCPMGAIFALLPVLPIFALCRDRENCLKGCSACERKCPSGIGLPEDGSWEVSGDCFQCHKCVGACPKTNIHCEVHARLKGNEIWLTVIRAGILLGLLVWLGV